MIANATGSHGTVSSLGVHLSPLVPPTAAAVAGGITAYHWALFPSFANSPDAIAAGGAIASVGGTMVGFMLAALAVLASINHTHLIGMMKKTGHYSDLLFTLFVGGSFFLACLTVGFALMFGLNRTPEAMSVVVGLHLGALASLLDVGRKFWLVLSNLRAAP